MKWHGLSGNFPLGKWFIYKKIIEGSLEVKLRTRQYGHKMGRVREEKREE